MHFAAQAVVRRLQAHIVGRKVGIAPWNTGIIGIIGKRIRGDVVTGKGLVASIIDYIR